MKLRQPHMPFDQLTNIGKWHNDISHSPTMETSCRKNRHMTLCHTSFSEHDVSLEVSCIVANASVPCGDVALVCVICGLSARHNSLLASSGSNHYPWILCQTYCGLQCQVWDNIVNCNLQQAML